jgi:hypothetical protein
MGDEAMTGLIEELGAIQLRAIIWFKKASPFRVGEER